MQLKKVSFDLAKKLDEIGFDVTTGTDCCKKTLDDEIIHNKDRRNCAKHDRAKRYLNEPTLELAKKWFREVMKIEVEVSFDEGLLQLPYGFLVKPCDYKVEGYFVNGFVMNGFESYDVALENGLLRACEIVKKEKIKKITTMTGIACKNRHIFSMIVDEYIDAEWKLQEAYYKAQGCQIIKGDNLNLTQANKCESCQKLEHQFDNLIKEVLEKYEEQ